MDEEIVENRGRIEFDVEITIVSAILPKLTVTTRLFPF